MKYKMELIVVKTNLQDGTERKKQKRMLMKYEKPLKIDCKRLFKCYNVLH